MFNEINDILEDKDGLLWLLETGSLRNQQIKNISVFNPLDHSVRSLQEQFGADLPFSPADIVGFNQTEKGHLVFVHQNGKLITYADSWEILDTELGEYYIFHRIHWSPSGQFWVTLEQPDNTQTLLIFDEKGKLLHQYKHAPSQYLYVHELDKFGTGKYFTVFHKKSQSKQSATFFSINPAGEQSIDSISPVSQYKAPFFDLHALGKIQESPEHHWIFFDYDQRSFRVIEKETGIEIATLNEDYPDLEITNNIYLDKDQAIWVGTPFGVYRFQLKTNHFKKFLFNQQHKGDSDLFTCRQITADNYNNIWVRVENPKSIWKINLDTYEEKDVSQTGGSLPSLPKLSNTNYSIFQTSDGDLLYPTSDQIIKVNPQTHSYTIIESLNKRRGIWSFYEDHYRRIWFHDQPRDEFGYLENEKTFLLPDKLSETENPYIYQYFTKNSQDIIWLVTSNGLFTFNIQSRKLLERYWNDGKGKYYFPYDNVHHIHADPDGSVWMATAGYGLIHAHLSEEKITILRQYTRADGLPNNTLYAVYGDEFGQLWMSSDYGIVRFDKKTGRIKGFTENDGITHNEFNRVSHFQDKQGRIFFGGLNGITSFHPKDFQLDSSVSNSVLAITNFEQFDGKENKLIDNLSDLRQNNKIVFNPEDLFFRLEFALLNFSETSKHQYAYKIEGFDKDWNFQQENTLRFSRLPYGKYQLRIKGQSSNGSWSENELNIQVLVLKPFYLQTWFLVILALSLLFSGFVLSLWRMSKLATRQRELEQTIQERTKKIVADRKVIEKQNQILEKQAKDLKSLEKLKSRFFANVSHELRTPLTLILGPVSSLLEQTGKNEKQTLLLQFIQRNARHLQKLINEILDLSKLEENKIKVLETSTLLYPFLKNQLAQFYSHATGRNLHFEFNFRLNKKQEILLDKNKFEKILHNFLSNAMKFTAEGGKITLELKELNSHIQMSVADTGQGIHPDDQPFIFNRFYQAGKSATDYSGGTGIGLSLCKELAELLGGKVWVKSKLDEGSTFYFRFPKKEIARGENRSAIHTIEPVEKTPENASGLINIQGLSSGKDQEVPGNTKPVVLIVEDNPDLRRYLRLLLLEFKVFTAVHGQDALDQLTNNQPTLKVDLIISDLMMPVMDGFRFLEKLKSDDRWRHIPTIMLTAKINPKSKLRALRIGVDDYLSKPFQEIELKSRIENLLRNYRERMHLFSQNSKKDSNTQTLEKTRFFGFRYGMVENGRNRFCTTTF